MDISTQTYLLLFTYVQQVRLPGDIFAGMMTVLDSILKTSGDFPIHNSTNYFGFHCVSIY